MYSLSGAVNRQQAQICFFAAWTVREGESGVSEFIHNVSAMSRRQYVQDESQWHTALCCECCLA